MSCFFLAAYAMHTTCHVCNSCSPIFIMPNFVLYLSVVCSISQQVVNCFVVYLQKLSFHGIFPVALAQFLRHVVNLLHCARNHAGWLFVVCTWRSLHCIRLNINFPVLVCLMQQHMIHLLFPHSFTLPLPVWPYAKIQTLYPSSADCTSCEISS